MAKLYIVDEHTTVRKALAERLAKAHGLEVVGHSGEYSEVMREVEALKPEIVLLEVKRRDGMGLEMARQIAGLPYGPRLIVLTSYPTTWEQKAATRAGAVHYLLKDIDSEELIRQISELVEA